MKEERDILVKRIFPVLKKACEERGVTWGEVDLRWGVTEEQSAEGKVLPICLEEIKRCRPFFIGLLGERYGWIPDAIPKDLIMREPWLKEHLSHSVTELEILHGVLNNPAMTAHAFFYLRDPGYLKKLPEGANLSEFVSEDKASGEKLDDLKKRIRRSNFPIHENYADPEAAGELILRDIQGVIDNLYPPDETIDPLDRDALDHEAFAQSRARVYIGRDEYFKRLDEHVKNSEPPLVVLGESGSGKSALLANWALQKKNRPVKHTPARRVSLIEKLVLWGTDEEERDDHPPVLFHFVGASPYSANWASMVRRIMGELKRLFHIEEEVPDKPEELRLAFANWLSMASAKGKIVLIIDALNQLEDRDGAPDLVWLPPVLPGNVSLIVSTLPGRSLDEIRKRGWATLTVEPLTDEERGLFITKYLAQYTKELSPHHIEMVLRTYP